MIDINKKLALKVPNQDHEPPVKLLGRTSEGNLIVDTVRTGQAAPWYVFDETGAFVTSADGSGHGVRLVNASSEKTLYVALSGYRGRDALRIDDRPQNGTMVACVALKFKDGILVDASIERANTNPIRKVEAVGAGVQNRVLDL